MPNSEHTATDKLRKLLEERGVNWTEFIDRTATAWTDGTHGIVADESGDNKLWLTMSMMTPEQAIAATLGRGTCEIYRVGNTRDIRKCSACGKQMHFDHSLDRDCLHYCPNCGREVVD